MTEEVPWFLWVRVQLLLGLQGCVLDPKTWGPVTCSIDSELLGSGEALPCQCWLPPVTWALLAELKQKLEKTQFLLSVWAPLSFPAGVGVGLEGFGCDIAAPLQP